MMQGTRESMKRDFINAFFTAVRYSTALHMRHGRDSSFTFIKSGTRKRFFLQIITSLESDEYLRMEIYNDADEHVATLNHRAILDACVENRKWWWREVVNEVIYNLWGTGLKRLTSTQKDGWKYIQLTSDSSNERDDMQESTRPVSDAFTALNEIVQQSDELYRWKRMDRKNRAAIILKMSGSNRQFIIVDRDQSEGSAIRVLDLNLSHVADLSADKIAWRYDVYGLADCKEIADALKSSLFDGLSRKNEFVTMKLSPPGKENAPTHNPEPEVAGISDEDKMYQRNRIVDAWPAEWDLFEAERTWFLRYSVTDRPGIDYIAMLQPIECSGEAFMYGLKNSIIGSLCPTTGGSKVGKIDQVIPGMIVDAETYEDCAKALRPLVEDFMESQARIQKLKS